MPTILVPRLRLDNGTAAKIRGMADEEGIGMGEVIGRIVEESLNRPDGREMTYRLIQVGEKMGLGVGGPNTYPGDWHRMGGLTHEECRHIAAGYIAWRQEQNGQTRSPDKAGRGPV